jgi:nucleotide-binding universal stress UspA family protein
MTADVTLRSILSPVDFSEHSRHALRWAGAFAARFHSELTIVSVVDPLLADAARIKLGHDLAQTETDPALREFVATTWPGSTSLKTAFRTPIGDAATKILETATTERADLIVIGTQGLGGFRKWLLGSTTERLLRKTRLPVLAVPLPSEAQAARPDTPLVSHIAVAIDFSDSSVMATRVAAVVARAFAAKLTLTHIVESVFVPPQWQPLLEESDEARTANSRVRLKALAEEICGSHACDEVVAQGRPAEVIGTVARERRADLIVMGLANDEGMFAPRPGSVAYRVLCSTTIPVLVIPATLK